MLFLQFVLILLLVYLAYFYLVSKPHPKFPPGPLRWPIWGGYLQLLVENYKYTHKALHWMARRYKTEVLGIYMGSVPTVVACSHASAREIFTRPEFQGRVPAIIPESRDPDGVIRGQFFIDGPGWTEQRRFMLRTLRDFGFGTRNKKLEKIIEEEIRDFMDLVQSNVEGVCHEGEVLVPPAFYGTFLNITLQVVLGARLPKHLHGKLRDFAYMALRFQLAVDPTTGMINMTPWVRHVAPEWSGYADCIKANEAIKQFIKEMVVEHKDTFMLEALRDFCDVYLKEMGEKNLSGSTHWFTEEQMVMTMWDLLFPSAMAVTAVMGFTVQRLLHHPEVQEKAQKELDEVVGRSRLPTLDDRKNLPYTEAVLREALRRETLTPLALPHRCTEDTYFYGYFIPKDTMMMANVWSSHMDEKVWGNPLDFQPERYLDENGQIKKKDFAMPFGLGKRLCSGETFARQNMFLMLAAMLQNFRLELPPGQPLPDMEDPLPGINVSPKPFRVCMVPR